MNSLRIGTLLLLLAGQAFGVGAIIEITRNLQMTLRDPLPPKNYVLDVGQKDGVQVGEILDVFRSVPVMNAVSGRPGPMMKIHLGEIKVVSLGEAVSVARMERQIETSELPVKGIAVFQVGDQIARKSSLPFQ